MVLRVALALCLEHVPYLSVVPRLTLLLGVVVMYCRLKSCSWVVLIVPATYSRTRNLVVSRRTSNTAHTVRMTVLF